MHETGAIVIVSKGIAAHKQNKDKGIERRLQVLCLRADSKTLPEISELTDTTQLL